MSSFARSGYMINADIIYPGLTTVAVPLARPGDGTLFALNCTALSATLPADRIRRDVGPAMVDVAKRLSAALAKET
jgi:DNA-binding IclR family transcriptional regulator